MAMRFDWSRKHRDEAKATGESLFAFAVDGEDGQHQFCGTVDPEIAHIMAVTMMRLYGIKDVDGVLAEARKATQEHEATQQADPLLHIGRWISTKEKTPDVLETVLGYWQGLYDHCSWRLISGEKKWFSTRGGPRSINVEPSHWMTLPGPPKEDS